MNNNISLSIIFHYIGGVGPMLSALTLIYATKDKSFIKDFWIRVINVKLIKFGYYIFILLFIPVIKISSIILFRLFSNMSIEIRISEDFLNNPLSVMLTVLFILVFGPIPEELGWRGYAIDGLTDKYNKFISSLILGSIWCVWHIPLFFIKGSWQQSYLLTEPLLIIYFFTGIVLNTFIMTWIFYRNNRSILSAILYHFIVNLSGNFFDSQTALSKLIELGLLLLSVILIILLNKDFFFKKR